MTLLMLEGGHVGSVLAPMLMKTWEASEGRKLSWRSARAGRATAQRHAVARNRDGGKGIGCCCAGWVRLLAGGAALLNSGSAR